jgi:predicted  nucleic acid-binding Zn-ribbon protein
VATAAFLALQVRQLKAEARHMEEDSAAVSKEIQAAEAAIAKSNVKQQALARQRTLRQLEAEKAHALEEQAQLADPHASMDALHVRLRCLVCEIFLGHRLCMD